MRSTLLELVLALGLLTAALAPAAACEWRASMAAGNQASTSQTAQAQPPAQNQSN